MHPLIACSGSKHKKGMGERERVHREKKKMSEKKPKELKKEKRL